MHLDLKKIPCSGKGLWGRVAVRQKKPFLFYFLFFVVVAAVVAVVGVVVGVVVVLVVAAVGHLQSV